MFKVSDYAAKALLRGNTYGFAGFGKKRPATKSDLAKYDVVVVGGNLGAVFSTHLDAAMQDKVKIYVCYDQPNFTLHPQRNLYEQARYLKYEMKLATRTVIAKTNAHSQAVGVDKINPQKSEVVLKNGRTIGYENLVVATGQKQNYASIKGFQQAWADPEHPFFTNMDNPQWKGDVIKPHKYFYNFNGGESIFYIPPENYFGAIQNYNFFINKHIMDLHNASGRICLDYSKFTVINANDSFVPHFNTAHQYIHSELINRGVNVQYGLKLIEVRKADGVAVFQDMKTGETSERPYGSFYGLMPTKPQDIIQQSGLADSTGYMDVDRSTLMSTKYDNIFGLGDCTNVPTTKTFYAGFDQVSVLRNNIERRLNGHDMNAKYQGFSKAALFTGPSSVCWVNHLYDQKQKSFSTSGLSCGLNGFIYNKFGKKTISNIYKFKNWGPPYYKFKKTYQGGSTGSTNPLSKNLHPQQQKAQ